MIIICDNCKRQVKTIQSNKPFKNDFIDVGLECPHCETFYHSYYDHPKLQARRKKLKNTDAKKELAARKRYTTYFQKMQRLASGLT